MARVTRQCEGRRVVRARQAAAPTGKDPARVRGGGQVDGVAIEVGVGGTGQHGANLHRTIAYGVDVDVQNGQDLDVAKTGVDLVGHQQDRAVEHLVGRGILDLKDPVFRFICAHPPGLKAVESALAGDLGLGPQLEDSGAYSAEPGSRLHPSGCHSARCKWPAWARHCSRSRFR